jgi:hypothetical protein
MRTYSLFTELSLVKSWSSWAGAPSALRSTISAINCQVIAGVSRRLETDSILEGSASTVEKCYEHVTLGAATGVTHMSHSVLLLVLHICHTRCCY